MMWTTWAWEYSAVLGSTASFAAMVALLAAFDGKEVFTWKDVTLNAIVSVLSLTMKACLAYILAECIAQWKWILFARESRPLIDFDRIDAATRGPLGSLRVLTRTKGPPFLQFGAALTLLIIGLDPFTQQLIQFRSDVELRSNVGNDTSARALISQTSRYMMGQPTLEVANGTGTFKPELPLSMKAAILAGLSRAPEEVEQEVLVQCPTSNCTWDPFLTLGVCHRCNDVTAKLSRFVDRIDYVRLIDSIDASVGLSSNVNPDDIRRLSITAYSLPNGHFIANGNGCSLFDHSTACSPKLEGMGDSIAALRTYTATSFGTGNPNKTNTMTDIDTLIWSMSVIYPDVKRLNRSSLWPDVPLQAMECAIYYCVKNVTSSMEGNRLSESITEVNSVRDPDSWQRFDSEDVPPPPPEEADSLEFNPRYPEARYSDLRLKVTEPDLPYSDRVIVGGDSVTSISGYFQSLFLANYPNGPGPGVTEELEKKLGKGAVGVNGAFYASIGFSSDRALEAIPPALKNVWRWNRDNMTRTFYTLATSMTNEMRRNDKYPDDHSDSGGDDGTMTQHGKVRISTVGYEIQWAWMALHGTTLLLAIIFLCITLWNSRGPEHVPLWKSSALGTLRRGYQVGGALEGADTVQEMESVARKAYIKVPSRDVDESAACIQKDQASTGSEPERVAGSFEGIDPGVAR